jgi:hypothetical protein
MKARTLLALSLLIALGACGERSPERAAPAKDAEGSRAIETRMGPLSFTHDFANGFPTQATLEKLYDERDFQRACQAYLWSFLRAFRTGDACAGSAGRDQYLLLAPGQTTPGDVSGYIVRHAPTVNIMLGVRLTDTDPQRAKEALAQLQMYPYAQRQSPPKTEILEAGTRTWSGLPPRGMEYWERLSDVIQQEPARSAESSDQAVLVGHAVRRRYACIDSQRAEDCGSLLTHGSADEPRRLGRYLLWAPGADRLREQLDSDRAGQELVRALPLLQPDRSVL